MWIDDQILSLSSQSIAYKVWVPNSYYIVIGNGNSLKKEVYLDRCIKDGIPIYRRSGGGGTVLLHPGCLILSLGCWVKDYYKNKEYFYNLNQAVIDTLEYLIKEGSLFTQKGLSDICCGNRKIAGTSLFRSRNYLMYQASILYSPQIEKISHYLSHPSQEPVYRAKKPHKEFLTSIAEISSYRGLTTLRDSFHSEFTTFLAKNMKNNLIPPQNSQMSHVKKRINRCEKSLSLKLNYNELTSE